MQHPLPTVTLCRVAFLIPEDFFTPPARVNSPFNSPILILPDILTCHTFEASKPSATVTSDQFSAQHPCAISVSISDTVRFLNVCSIIIISLVFSFFKAKIMTYFIVYKRVTGHFDIILPKSIRN